MNMKIPSLILVVLALIPFHFSPFSSSTNHIILNQGSSLSQRDVLLSSPNPIFTAGFYPVGENAYCFAIWFTDLSTVVWMANRDQPVNGRYTTLSLSDTGTLVLVDAGSAIVWTSAGTRSPPSSSSPSFMQLQLHDNGNLVLRNSINGDHIWQSFDSPTNTLLPQQPLTRTTQLISSRSLTNYSSGFYKLYFDKDNVLRLVYEGIEITSSFWPPPWLNSWQAGRTTFNDSKIAVLDSFGNFISSDYFQFETSDLAKGPQRRLILEPDGLLRVYSLQNDNNKWQVTWQVSLQPCRTHGICGANGLCTYTPELGPRCACLPGYKIKNHIDWSEGCVPDFELRCNDNTEDDSSTFLALNHVEYYGYDIGYYQNYTLDQCKKLCLSYCSCKGFQYKFEPGNGVYSCFPKTLLFNGYQSTGFQYWIYLRLPKDGLSPDKRSIQKTDLQCTSRVMEIERVYRKQNEHSWLKPLASCAGVIGAIELICVLVFLYKTRQRSSVTGGYLQVGTGFKRFTYAELKKASRNFGQEVGRGGSGVVYKGTLPDNRVAAIKCLINEAKQGEAEFLAEVGTIGRLNHANLIEQWGYCVEGKHRILVYEYLENGSLAENLNSDKLDWRQRFDIALGTAKGLAYLHEECLEWVLHCDVKPQNILLDSSFQPKVADFGLSKQLKRGGVENMMNVSKIRGTRGYMAPEWVLNLPITSKVDVYSYGIVVMEMITGKSPQELVNVDGGMEQKMDLVREMMDREEFDDDDGKMENLMRVALQCAQENKEARPTMRQVIHMLLDQET